MSCGRINLYLYPVVVKSYLVFFFHFMRRIFYLFSIISVLVVISCSSDNDNFPTDDTTPQEVSPVVFDLNAVPYAKISDYNFFKSPLNQLKPVYGVLPFEPASSLFTDYVSKSRFIWMPENVSASYTSDDEVFKFGEGTVLIKNFYYENALPEHAQKILETRLIFKKNGNWVFANYVWNDEQTEAYYDMDGSIVPVEFVQNGETKQVNYRIPSQGECLICHKRQDNAIPIGPKPQNLNFTLSYQDGTYNQIDKWEDIGYLDLGTPSNINSIVDYRDSSKSLDERVRSYFDINCAHCHNEQGHCNYLPIKLSFSETTDPSKLGICVEPDIDISSMVGEEVTHIVRPGHPLQSATYQRMNTEQANLQMPLIGRSLVDTEAVQLVEQWINSLEGDCN